MYSYTANGSDLYRSVELSRALGMSLRQLQWLAETRVVMPAHQGHNRMWSRQEACLAVVAQRLRGVVPYGERLRKAVRQAERILVSGPRFLIASRESFWTAMNEHEVVQRFVDCSEKRIPVIVIDMDAIRRKLQAKASAAHG